MGCPRHEAEPVTGTCSRCGDFLCRLDATAAPDGLRCPVCVLPASDAWVEPFRKRYHGKRDGYAWFFLALAPVQGAVVVHTALTPIPGAAARGILLASALAGAGLSVLFGLGLRPARALLPWLALASFFAVAVAAPGARPPAGVFVHGLALAIGFQAQKSTRDALFFREPVSLPELRAFYELVRENPGARYGYILSYFALLAPGASLVTLALCLVGLVSVDPGSDPPVGRRREAIAGLAISAVGCVLWGVGLAYAYA